MFIYIGDLPNPVLLAALYNNALVKGSASRNPADRHMSVEQATVICVEHSMTPCIGNLMGRTIGVDFSFSHIDPTIYNASNPGCRTMQEIVEHIRSLYPVPDEKTLAEMCRDFRKEDGN